MKRFKLIGLWTGIVTVFAALLYPIWLWQDGTIIGIHSISLEGPRGTESYYELPDMPNLDEPATRIGIYTIVAGLVTWGLWLSLRRRAKG